jgi:L-alanine-DL-glutamate epimerase-like enolase superfamily enzyme
MKVTEVTVTPVVAPLDRPISGSHYRKAERGTAIVRIETEGDVVGEAYSASIVGTPERRETVVRLLRDDLLPIVRGRKLLSIEATWEAMFSLVDRYMPSGKGERSLLMHALAAVDAALWDAIGKAAGVPLYRLWGGYRDSVPVIAIGGYYGDGKTDDDLVAEMEGYREMGLAGVKLKVGGRSVEEDLARLAAVREAMGESFVIACDANQGYTVDQAVAFAEGARGHDVTVLTSDHGHGDRPSHESRAGYDVVRTRQVALPFGYSISPGIPSSPRRRLPDLRRRGVSREARPPRTASSAER